MPAKKHIDLKSFARAARRGDLTNQELADRFGIHHSSVYYYLNRLGLWHGKSRAHIVRHRRATMPIAAAPKSLTCWKCGRNSIPAPSGATPETRYVCRECSPICPNDEHHFDRCQNDSAGFHPHSERLALADRLLNLGQEDMLDVPSRLLLTAEEKRKAWALRATRPRVFRLPDRMRKAFMAHYYAGLTLPQVAQCMDTNLCNVRQLIYCAKKKLSKTA